MQTTYNLRPDNRRMDRFGSFGMRAARRCSRRRATYISRHACRTRPDGLLRWRLPAVPARDRLLSRLPRRRSGRLGRCRRVRRRTCARPAACGRARAVPCPRCRRASCRGRRRLRGSVARIARVQSARPAVRVVPAAPATGPRLRLFPRVASAPAATCRRARSENVRRQDNTALARRRTALGPGGRDGGHLDLSSDSRAVARRSDPRFRRCASRDGDPPPCRDRGGAAARRAEPPAAGVARRRVPDRRGPGAVRPACRSCPSCARCSSAAASTRPAIATKRSPPSIVRRDGCCVHGPSSWAEGRRRPSCSRGGSRVQSASKRASSISSTHRRRPANGRRRVVLFSTRRIGAPGATRTRDLQLRRAGLGT
jgi:hypothetical protein